MDRLRKERNRWWLLALAVVWLGLIGFVSLNSSPPGSETLQGFASWFPFPETALRILQAVIHMFLFGVWAVLCMLTIRSFSPRMVWYVVLAATLGVVFVAGGVIEIAQMWIPNRAADLLDFSGNMTGAVLFLGVWQRNHTRKFLDETADARR
ncbi:VanZ family protein [Candidatus Sumerlaeota bacterium]|nr:VanZ family protein [Candidatus Sumerlaeota bacterium]